MKHIFLHLIIALTLVFSISLPVLSQQCAIDPVVMQQLRKPRFGTPSLWQTVVGNADFHAELTAGYATPNNTVIVSGVRDTGAEKQDVMILASIDSRGRATWTQSLSVDDITEVKTILPRSSGGMTALVEMGGQNPKTALLFISPTYTIEKTQTLPFIAEAMIYAPNGKSLLIAGNMMPKIGQPYAVIYGYDMRGKQTFKRSYRPGGGTTLLNLRAMPEGLIAAAGHITDSKNRQAAWTVIVKPDGEVVWQQQYSRGKAARILDIASLNKTTLVVSGQIVSPDPKTGSAGWVAALDKNRGDLVWERFYTNDKFHTAAQSLVMNNDGTFAALLRNKPAYPETMMKGYFAKLAVINKRGFMLDARDYSSGQGARLNMMIKGNQDEHIIIGGTTREYMVNDTAAGELLTMAKDKMKKMMGAQDLTPDPNTTLKIGQIDTSDLSDTRTGAGSKTAAKTSETIEQANAETEPPTVLADNGYIVAAPASDTYVDPCEPPKPSNSRTEEAQKQPSPAFRSENVFPE